MPARIPHRCAVPTCPELVAKGTYCEQHRTDAYRQKRETYGHSYYKGYNHRWRRYRKAFLAQNPLCVACSAEGRLSAATELDHIEPSSVRPDLFWDRSNHQGLCHKHHSEKTTRERMVRYGLIS